MSLPFVQVDVFTRTPYSGNSLVVFPDARGLTAPQMQRITQEMRHFEAIFLEPTERQGRVRARVFDLFEELPFAGHPVLGAGAVLHRTAGGGQDERNWTIALRDKDVTVATKGLDGAVYAVLDQGGADLLGSVDDRAAVAAAWGLSECDLDPDLPVEVISTGLRYLIVPVRPGRLERARHADITAFLLGFGADFAVMLEEAALEVRHWNNDGIIEDVATGSAAGTIGAYRLRHGLTRSGETFLLNQGRFTGRPSVLRVQPEGSRDTITSVKVGGDVAFVGQGVLEVLP